MANREGIRDDIIGANSAYTGSSQSDILAAIQRTDLQWQSTPENATTPLMDAILTNTASGRLHTFQAGVSDHIEVFVTDRYGALVGSTARTSDYYQADEEWWQAAWNEGNGATYISSPVYDESLAQIVIEIAMPIRDTTGQVIGILRDNYSLSGVVAEAEAFHYGDTGHLHIIDSAGNIVYSPDSDLSQVGTPEDSAMLLAGRVFAETGSNLNVNARREDKGVVMGYSPMTTHGATPEIDQMGWTVLIVQDRSEAFRLVNDYMIFTAVAVAVAFVIAVLLAVGLSRLLVRQVNEISKVFRSVAVGEFDVRARVLGHDELGQAAEGFNALLAMLTALLNEAESQLGDRVKELTALHETSRLVQVEEKSVEEVLQAVVELLPPAFQYPDVTVARITYGGMSFATPRFTSTPWKLSAAFMTSDSVQGMVEVNYLEEQLAEFEGPFFAEERSLINSVAETLRAYLERHQAERRIREQNEALAVALDDLRRVASEVETTAVEVTHASETMREVVGLMTDQAASSATVAERAASSALEGDRVVHETIAAMTRIRTNTQETAQRIKRLGEVSQEIGEAARLIEDLADRTTILALNASIQAAAAGDAGRGFAVVAEEVQRLAERATSTARQIDQLITNIRAEANEAMVSVGEVTREVVGGSTLAQTAGEQMSTLNQLAGELSNLIQHLAETTALQTSDSLYKLASLTENLQKTVASFRGD
jgi:methyl-accepting chemotaxis protein